MDLSRTSTISDLINSKNSMKKLRVILSIRDTTIKEVFNAAGYFYEAKMHKWVKKEEGLISENITFQEALEQLSLNKSDSGKSRTNKKLIETNSNEIKSGIVEVSATSEKTNNELIKPNSNTRVEVLDAPRFTMAEWNVLREVINERINQTKTVDINEIYNEVARLKTRKRKNKTFYISEELTQEVVEFAEELNVKISQLVEVSLIEMLKKYKTNIK